MQVTPEGFAHMTHQLAVLAKGKLVLALEVSEFFFTSLFFYFEVCLTYSCSNRTGRIQR